MERGMFGHNQIFSISEINRIYPDQWVAITVEETDSDGFAVRGQILSHNEDERVVWTAVKLGDLEDPVYVFYTGRRKAA
jgi:hypothetical protein